MNPKIINSIEDWNILEKALKEKRYFRFIMQFSFNEPEGFHAWFRKKLDNYREESKDVEVITKCEAVQNAIICYDKN